VSPPRRLSIDLAAWGERPAIIEPGRGVVSYAALDSLVEQATSRLRRLGLRAGDRIGICARRSADVIALMQAAWRLDAVYVPVDPGAPVARNVGIHVACGVRVVFVEDKRCAAYAAKLVESGVNIPVVSLDAVGLGAGVRAWVDKADEIVLAEVSPATRHDIAYILFTSGSTGAPKGVTITHENCAAFVSWCCEVLRPTPEDRFGNHAQFHFDLSVLDIYCPLTTGAALVICPDEVGREAKLVLDLLEHERITIWYSAPAVLALMAQLGTIAQRDLSALRVLCFAGEVFPIVHLKSLKRQLPGPRYLNLYGPTETNVCTSYELPASIETFDRPCPIGPACPHYEARVVDERGARVPHGAEGELVMRGPGVMAGYWGRPDLTQEKLLVADDGGRPWYRTGDIVTESNGVFVYVGRRDRMIKRRGYRVELGEIEARLFEHPKVKDAAVVTGSSPDGITLHAHLVTRDGAPLSVLEIKTFCGQQLPSYMVPDSFVYHAALPRTSTEKVDYQRLAAAT
jgi:amino acid adenylation domain-containing protein